MLSFWALDQAAYYLALFGIISLLIAGALFKTSRWAWWLGLFSFPIYFVDVAYALLTSVNLVGWYSDLPTGTFHASMITYLVFLCVGFILLLDRRNVLRSDSILDLLNKPLSSKPAATGKQIVRSSHELLEYSLFLEFGRSRMFSRTTLQSPHVNC